MRAANRRRFLGRLGLAGMAGLFSVRPLQALPEALLPAVRQMFGGRLPVTGGVDLALPALAENGNSVRVSVTVDSPMSVNDRVASVALFAERNPLPEVVQIRFGELAGSAHVETRIRLAIDQQVLAVAEHRDGRLNWAAARILVTESACLDALL